jgi:hypothetical protein
MISMQLPKWQYLNLTEGEGRTGQPKRKSWTWSEEAKRNRGIAVKEFYKRKKHQQENQSKEEI